MTASRKLLLAFAACTSLGAAASAFADGRYRDLGHGHRHGHHRHNSSRGADQSHSAHFADRRGCNSPTTGSHVPYTVRSCDGWPVNSLCCFRRACRFNVSWRFGGANPTGIHVPKAVRSCDG